MSSGERGPASMSLDVDPTTPDHSDLSRGEGPSSFPSSSGATDAGSGASASGARSRPCPYTDVRTLDQRSGHGDAAAASAPALIGWTASAGAASSGAASSGAASSSGLPWMRNVRFTLRPANPGTTRAAPWPDQWNERTLTFLSNVLPPATPRDYVRAQQTGRPVGGFEPDDFSASCCRKNGQAS